MATSFDVTDYDYSFEDEEPADELPEKKPCDRFEKHGHYCNTFYYLYWIIIGFVLGLFIALLIGYWAWKITMDGFLCFLYYPPFNGLDPAYVLYTRTHKYLAI